MEVASPLPFTHANAGSKRRFACSPLHDSVQMDAVSSMEDSNMDDSICYGPNYKRRRFGSSPAENEVGGANFVPPSNLGNMNQAFTPISTPYDNSFLSSAHLSMQSSSIKRQRTHEPPVAQPGLNPNNPNSYQQIIEKQEADILRLSHEKKEIENSNKEIKATNEKIQHENKILKRAVTIQQERQSQAASELEASQKYKHEAEERIRRLEQIIITLRYHLQTSQPCAGNDFMGSMNPRPPDVF